MCKNICNKIIGVLVIIVAITLAIVVSIWHQEGLAYIIFISRFFDVMLPVLAVGALLKYLICGCGCHCHNDTCKKD